jgi:nicotinate dehydrogenase large molybdopterin subunit
MVRFLAVGKAAPRTEGPEKVAGKATYAADIMFPRIVWGKAVRSGFPHARIVSIDTSKAKAHPGVLAVITAQDVPDVLTGRQLQDTPILARDRVRFIGERVAVVGAESREIAEEAAALIDIEYEEWPAVFDPIDAMRRGAPLLHQEALTPTCRSPWLKFQMFTRTFSGWSEIVKGALPNRI